jgi:ribosomal protein L28
MFGHNRSHALNATRKISQPNVFKKNLVIDGEKKRLNVCARCIRTLQKQGKYQIAAK